MAAEKKIAAQTEEAKVEETKKETKKTTTKKPRTTKKAEATKAEEVVKETATEKKTTAKKAPAKKKADADNKVVNDLLEEVVKGIEVEIPAVMVEEEIDNIVNNFNYRLQSQGLDLNTYFKYTGLTLETLREQMRPQAEKQVKGRLALEYIAKVENLTASEEDINTEYQKIADAYNLEIEKVKASIDSAAIAADVVVGKAALFLRENAAISTAEEEAK